MHPQFLPYLKDPKTSEPLTLEPTEMAGERVVAGCLVSSSNRYPIVRGVPRFAGYNENSAYARSFAYQWSRWGQVQFEAENVGRSMEGHTLRMWERIVGTNTRDLKNGVFGDFGCGPGRFVDIVRRKRGRVIGLDLSFAVESAAEYFRDDTDVLICQADVLEPPIVAGMLDGAFSIGVFHHTPDPQRALCEMARTVRSGGWVASVVYERGKYYDFPAVTFWRRIFKLLWPVFRHYPPLVYAYITAYGLRPLTYIPIVGKLIRGVLPFARLPDPRWSVLDTFDSVTPSYQSTHDSTEVQHWYATAGLKDVQPSDWGSTAYHGLRP